MRVAAPATPGKSCASSCVLPLRHLRPLKRTQSNGLRGSSRRKARGWVSDRLKNTTEEIELKELWDVHVKGVRKVSKELEFVGSESYPEVQLADVLLGLLRGVFERDGEIPRAFGDLIRRAQDSRLKLLNRTDGLHLIYLRVTVGGSS